MIPLGDHIDIDNPAAIISLLHTLLNSYAVRVIFLFRMLSLSLSSYLPIYLSHFDIPRAQIKAETGWAPTHRLVTMVSMEIFKANLHQMFHPTDAEQNQRMETEFNLNEATQFAQAIGAVIEKIDGMNCKLELYHHRQCLDLRNRCLGLSELPQLIENEHIPLITKSLAIENHYRKSELVNEFFVYTRMYAAYMSARPSSRGPVTLTESLSFWVSADASEKMPNLAPLALRAHQIPDMTDAEGFFALMSSVVADLRRQSSDEVVMRESIFAFNHECCTRHSAVPQEPV